MAFGDYASPGSGSSGSSGSSAATDALEEDIEDIEDRIIAPFDDTKAYEPGVHMSLDGKLYVNITTTAGAFNATEWTELCVSDLTLAEHSTTVDYVAGDFVSFGNRIYKANGSAIGVFNIADWTPQSNLDERLRVFDNTSTYEQNDFVSFGNRIYKANGLVTGSVTSAFDASDWTLQSDLDERLVVFDTTSTYEQNDFVSFDEKLYRANSAIGAGPFTDFQWTLQNEVLAPLAEHLRTVDYVTGDFVSFDDRIYKALMPNTGTFDPIDWLIQSDIDKSLEVFDATKDYEADSFVSFGDVVYRATAAITAGVFTVSEWTVQGSASVLEGWTDAIMVNGYTSHSTVPVQYKRAGGITYVQGLALNSANHTDGTHTIFDLPAAYSPSVRLGFNVIHDNNVTACRVDVLDNGNVQQIGNMANYAYVNFSFVHI